VFTAPKFTLPPPEIAGPLVAELGADMLESYIFSSAFFPQEQHEEEHPAADQTDQHDRAAQD
jgi:hypothetical protein